MRESPCADALWALRERPCLSLAGTGGVIQRIKVKDYETCASCIGVPGATQASLEDGKKMHAVEWLPLKRGARR